MSEIVFFHRCPIYDHRDTMHRAGEYLEPLLVNCDRCFGLGVYEDEKGSIRLCERYAKWRLEEIL